MTDMAVHIVVQHHLRIHAYSMIFPSPSISSSLEASVRLESIPYYILLALSPQHLKTFPYGTSMLKASFISYIPTPCCLLLVGNLKTLHLFVIHIPTSNHLTSQSLFLPLHRCTPQVSCTSHPGQTHLQ